MAKKWDEELRKAALKAAQQKGVMRQEQPSNMYRAAAEAVMNRKSQNPTTKAGSNKPAFGVSANRLGNRAAIGLSAMSSVRNFEDYAKKRREQEEAEGMQRAAQNLLTATASSQSTLRIADEETQRAAEEEKARRAAAIEAANNLANQYGYKKAGGKVVYATPFSPLPDPRGERGATRAQAPGAYGIRPEDYARDMSAIDRYMGMSAPAYDEETRTFLDKYFGGKLPNDEEFVGRYRELMKNGQLTEDEMMNFHASAGLVQKATEQNAEYLKNREQAQKDYDAAIERIGEDAPKYATGREADYYERYRNTLGAKEILGQDDGTQDEISLFEAKTRLDAPFRALANDYDLHRWSQTTQQERDAYRLMREMYGEAAAEEYLDSLKGELNQRLAASEEQLAAARAERSPLLATLESVVTAPRRGIGAIGMGVERLLGKETDLYDPRLNLTREAEAIRAETASGMGGVGGFLYNTGMSMADNIANMAMWGGLGTFATMVSMGGNSAASAFNDAVSRGADQKQATTAAVLSGMAEAVFEKFSLDNVIQLAKGGGLKNVVGNIAKQMGIEASEELATGIANAMSDYFVMGEKSSYDLAIQQYMAAGMTEEEAQRQARMDVAKEIGLGALGGALSGGVMGAGGQLVGSMQRGSEQRVLDEMNQAVEQQQTEAAEEQPEEQPEKPDVREELLREYVPQDAQEAEQPVRTEKAEEEPAKEEKPADEPETQENGAALHAVRTATMQGEDGTEKRVRVVGVMTNDGVPVMVTEDENGERNYELAEDLSFGDETDELLAYEGVERMDARALRNYLEGYNAEQGTAQEYASAYNSVYMRARGGVDYEQAALSNEDARNHLTEDAMLDAYAAGLNAYNQEHETVQPAQVETVQAQETPEGAVFSARESAKGGRISKQYTAEGFKGLGKDGQKKMLAQMELLKAIASRTGRTITIVDSIKGKDGKRANAMYIPGTGEIRVALDAQEGAYAYAAMHELTHAMKHEHSGEWSGFTGFVKGVLEEGGKSWDELVEYQMDRFGYNRAQAEEEVICNTVPAILQDEANVLKLYKGNRKLFDKVMDWVKGLLNDIKVAGRELSKRSQSWAQMDALAADRKAMQEIYDRMMAVMEKPAENVADNNVVKMSQQESHYDYSKPFAEQIDDWLDGNFPKGDTFLVSSTPDVLQKIGFSKLPMSYDQKHMRQVLGKAKNRDHDLGVDFMKALPEMIADPVAIIDSQRDDGSIMMVLAHQNKNANDRPVVGIVRVEKGGGYNKVYVDANKLETVHSRGNLDEIITAAVEKEKAGGVGVYYVTEKKSLHSVLEHGQSQVLDSLNRTGYMHSIHDAGSNVKAELMDQTESRQFKRWFGDSKVVNEDGSPKLMYRGGNEDIEIFDRRKSKASNLYGRGFYFTESEEHAKQYGGVNSYYLRIEHPMDASSGDKQINQSQMRNFLEAVAEDEDYGLENYGYGATVDSVLRSLRGKDDFAALQDINATAVGDFVAAIELFNEVNGTKYDGIITPTETVVFDSRQIKSATDNAGTFDPENPNVKFSMRDTDENVQDAMSAEQKAYEQVKGHRITAAEADKLAGEMLKLSNSEYDRQKLAAELSRVFDYIERGEDVDWNQVDEELTTIMARVMGKSRTLDLEHEQEMDELRKYFKRVRISLNKGQEQEAANKVGSYDGYRKLLFGRVSLSRTGIGLDQVWGELSDINRELFPRDAREGDQPILLLEAVDAMKPKYHTGMGMNVEESASWLTGKLHEAYLSLPAVKAAAKSAKTFGDSVVALKNAMKRFEETSWSEYQNALRGIQEARGAQLRTKQQEETAALRAKYVKWRERDTQARKEREMKTRYRARIERTAGTLAKWIAKPTDAKHVPAGVQDSVRRMLEVLDFSGKSTKTAKELCDKLEALASAMENAQEKEDGNQEIFLERDQQMIDQIRWVAEMIRGNTEHHTSEGRGVYDLNGLELRELSKWLDVVRHVITEASKLRGSNLPGESVEQVAAMSMAEISRKKAWKDKKWPTKQWMQHFGPDMQDSFTFFERLGPTANAIFRGLREGFDKVTQLTRQAETYTKTILKDVNLQELTGKKAKKQTFQVKGGTVELTKANVMELYVLSRREQAQGHIYGGGIRIQGDDDVRAKALTKADVARIVGTLTADEKRVAEGMQAFLSRECASWGNETSMKLLGYRKFGEEYYWPIRTDSNTRNTTKLEDNYAANINAIKNQGMTKATIEGAENAIVIGDIFDTYTKHISNMAAYAGYALPLSDFTRWYNTRGVKTEIEQVLGKKGLTYINNFLMAVNGSGLQPDQSGLEKLAGVFSRNAKIASVGANARVVIQQPTSYARAAMYMSPKYLSKALAMKKPNEELVNRYCGIAQWKRWGFYETNIGPNLRQMIVGDETAAHKARKLAMKPAEWGDNWTLNHLWNACELETRELMPELARGTEEYYQAVGKRMSEIVDRTQVVDSVFHRSQMMRSKSGMAQMLTNFMSEPTKTYNMLMSAISDYADNRKNKQARNRVARALTVYAVSGLLTAAAAAVIDAFRDEDAEKEWLEKYTGAVGSNAVDNLNPLGLLPGVKDVLSMLEGYEPSRLDTQSIQRIMWAAQEIQKYAEGTSKQNLYGVSYKTAQALSSVLGVPVSNVMRDVNAVIQTVTGTSITKTPEARKSATLTQLYKAMEEGNTARAKKLREDLRLKAEMTPKEIDTALAEKLETDPKIREAYEAKAAKDYAKMNRAINALTARGYGREVVDKAISSYANDQKPKAEKAKDPGEQLAVTLYSKEDVVEAVKVLAGLEPGSVTESDVRAMISERVAGSEAADPEKSVKSGIQTELKKEYLAMEQKGNTAGMRKLAMVMENVLGTEQDAMDDWVRDQHADNLRAAVDGNNKTAALKAVTVMRRDGKTDSQIKSSLNKYKQLYIDAMKKGDRLTANRIKGILLSLGLKGKNGKSLYTEETFADWLKEN